MFSDALVTTVEVTEADEARALGAAVCAGIGTGVYSSLDATVQYPPPAHPRTRGGEP